MKALIFIGSSRLDSHTKALGEAIQSALESHGADVTCLELAAMNLPNADPAFHRDPHQHTNQKIQQLATQADEADIMVLLSPIYHNSYSALLKNALDNLSIAQFAGKAVGLGSQGGDRTSQAVDHLRIVARGLNAIAIPTQVCSQETDFTEEGGKYTLMEPGILKRVERFAEELVRIGGAVR